MIASTASDGGVRRTRGLQSAFIKLFARWACVVASDPRYLGIMSPLAMSARTTGLPTIHLKNGTAIAS
jgi:hypothetical protein